MPFTPEQIANAGKAAIDYYLKNKPIDQVSVERPVMRTLMSGKKSAPGAQQFIVEQLRYRYQSNFQWFNGSAVVTYNRRNTLEQAKFQWRSAHDGLALNEDQLAQNGITLTDANSRNPTKASGAEAMQLTNLFDEQMEVLRLGFEEAMSLSLLRDGTWHPEAIVGLEAMISLTPSSGTVGEINRGNAANVYWRNHANAALDAQADTFIDQLEIGFRACVRNGGRPTNIYVGGKAYDNIRYNLLNKHAGSAFLFNADAGSERSVEASTSNIKFHGIPVTWVPEFETLDEMFAYTGNSTWESRIYMVNHNFLRLRPLQGHDMVTRNPPRSYDRYEFYWAVTWRGSLTMGRANAHWVGRISNPAI